MFTNKSFIAGEKAPFKIEHHTLSSLQGGEKLFRFFSKRVLGSRRPLEPSPAIFKTEKISVGPYVLTGGELPALIMIDSISRQIPGVLGNELSPEENRISSNEVYTRPEVFKYKGKNYKVPAVLLSGNHAEIERWKKG